MLTCHGHRAIDKVAGEGLELSMTKLHIDVLETTCIGRDELGEEGDVNLHCRGECLCWSI